MRDIPFFLSESCNGMKYTEISLNCNQAAFYFPAIHEKVNETRKIC